MIQKHTIAAISTPQGIGALAIIRITGESAYQTFCRCISKTKEFNKIKDRVIKQYEVIDDKKCIVDEITAIKYTCPKSYTGEDLVEIFCHGGYYVIEKILELLLDNGARIADKGEFTKRAFLNGKIDLMKAESIQAIIESKNREEHSVAIDYYKQKNQKRILQIKDKINHELSFIEAEIEFQDEEQNEINARLPDTLNLVIEEIELEIERNEKVKQREDETTIVIAGPTNAGKSSVFNEILGFNRAIVSDVPGTTRDIVSEKIIINEKSVKILDTAGIRYTNDTIEIEGQKKTFEQVNETDIVIWVTDSSECISEEEKKAFENISNRVSFVVSNKIDLILNVNKSAYYKNSEKNIVEVSIKEKKNIIKMIEEIEKKIDHKGKFKTTPSIILNKRHRKTIEYMKDHLHLAIKNWNQKEIAAYYVKQAIEEIDIITGKNENEKILNNIFETFCIGK